MEIFDTLIGNEEIKKTLGKAIADSSFSHAYIIEGAKGTGKKTVARLASAAILCDSLLMRPCGTCLSCKKVMSDTHPDVKLIEVTKIDQIRDIKARLYDSPTESDYRIYIFENAHKMNVKAQNALLISLEEPPKNVIFFLLTEDAGALLETVRSRAQTLRTEFLCGSQIFDYLKGSAVGIGEDRLWEIVMASAGSLGYAIDLSDEKKASALIERREAALKLILSVLKNDAESVSKLLAYSSTPRDELKELLALCVTVIGDIILLKKDKGAPLHFFTSHRDALAIAQKYGLQKLICTYEALLTAISDLNTNSNTALTLMSVLVSSKKKGN